MKNIKGVIYYGLLPNKLKNNVSDILIRYYIITNNY